MHFRVLSGNREGRGNEEMICESYCVLDAISPNVTFLLGVIVFFWFINPSHDALHLDEDQSVMDAHTCSLLPP